MIPRSLPEAPALRARYHHRTGGDIRLSMAAAAAPEAGFGLTFRMIVKRCSNRL